MTPVPPSLTRFGDDLDAAAHRQLTARHRRRPRLAAAGTLAAAGIAAAAVLAFGAAGGSTTKAYAITTASDGSVLVHLDNVEAVPAAERQLASMVPGEWFDFEIQNGVGTATGPVTCTPDGSGAGASGPTVKLQLGDSDTETDIVPAGEQGAGPWHAIGCVIHSGDFPGVGNTGGDTTGS